MNIKQWFFNRFLTAEPKGEIDTPLSRKEIKPSPRIHSFIKSLLDDCSFAVSRLRTIDELLNNPRVEFVKGVHSRGTTQEFKGLGSISIIFNTETGEPLFAEILKQIEE